MPWLISPTLMMYLLSRCNELFVGNHTPLGNRFILIIEDLGTTSGEMNLGHLLPTITVLRANGLPHSLVSNERKSVSPVFNDKVSYSAPSDDSKLAWAALASAFVQAAVFAA